MRFEIIFSPEAAEDLGRLKAFVRAEVKESIEIHLRYEPTKLSKSRIKRLRGLSQPQYRLRIRDDLRVFYDVTETSVEILAIVSKSEAADWLSERGIGQ